MNNSFFLKRIGFHGEIRTLLVNVCSDFKIGKYVSHELVPTGYEDCNLILTTEKRKYFVKILASFRGNAECVRYVDIIEKVLEKGISHPSLYKSSQGFLYKIKEDKTQMRLMVMDHIDGKMFYETKRNPTEKEKKFILKQAALINQINFKPSFVYDNWAITNFLDQYKRKQQYLSKEDHTLINHLVGTFKSLSIPSLPHCFVHGDITKTNTMKGADGKIYILDFAVANYYPKIQELAVILCDLFFNPEKTENFPEIYRFTLDEYQKYIKITPDEISKLSDYVKLAHAMHVLCATYEKKVNNNSTEENNYFLNIGRKGLRFTSRLWPS